MLEDLKANFEWFDLIYDTLFLESDLDLEEREMTRMAIDLVVVMGKLPKPIQLLHNGMVRGDGFDAASPGDQRKFRGAVQKVVAAMEYSSSDQKKIVDAAVKSIPKRREGNVSRLAADIDTIDLDGLAEVSPPGWAGSVKAMKAKKGSEKIDNPWALAWYMKNKGATPHYKDQETSKDGKPVKKKRFQNEEVELLDEDLKLTKSDRKVLAAFADQKSAESKNLSTDGKKLDGAWMGGGGLASWKGGKIHLRDTGVRSGDVIARALKRVAPKNDLAESIELPTGLSGALAAAMGEGKKKGCPCGNDHKKCGCDDCEKLRAEDVELSEAMQIKPTTYKGQDGFQLSGKDSRGRKVKVFVRKRESADKLKAAYGSGADQGEISKIMKEGELPDDADAMFEELMAEGYGPCPKCSEIHEATSRERRPNGYTTCGACSERILSEKWDKGLQENMSLPLPLGSGGVDIYDIGIEAGYRIPQGVDANPGGGFRDIDLDEIRAAAMSRKPLATKIAKMQKDHPNLEHAAGEFTADELVEMGMAYDKGQAGSPLGTEEKVYAATYKALVIASMRKPQATPVAMMRQQPVAEDAPAMYGYEMPGAEESLDGAFESALEDESLMVEFENVDPETVIEKYKLKIKGPGHEKVAKAIERGIQKAASLCKINPPICKGNIGLVRNEMPQFPNDGVRNKFIASMKQKGVRVSKGKMRVGTLKATQAEILVTKVVGMIGSYLAGAFPAIKDPIVVSRDGFIVDGHHRWAALLLVSPGETMNVLRVDAPIKSLIPMVNEFPGVVNRGLTAKSILHKEGLDEAASRFELVYSTGGHGGPYQGEEAAKKAAERLLKGGRDKWIAVIPAADITNLTKAKVVWLLKRSGGWEKGPRPLPSVSPRGHYAEAFALGAEYLDVAEDYPAEIERAEENDIGSGLSGQLAKAMYHRDIEPGSGLPAVEAPGGEQYGDYQTV